MDNRFSYRHAIGGALTVLALYDASCFVFLARSCHDLGWGLIGSILGPVFLLPVTIVAATLGWICGGYLTPSQRRVFTIVASGIGVIASLVVYALTTPQSGPCGIDL